VKGRLDLGIRVSTHLQNARIADALFSQIQTRTDTDTVMDTNADTESDTTIKTDTDTDTGAGTARQSSFHLILLLGDGHELAAAHIDDAAIGRELHV
jgi:hypothetical protein